MKNFLVAMINKSGNMFNVDEDGQPRQLAIIPEHISRLVELSDNCHIYMDSLAFKAFDEKTLPNRFTRVFVNYKDFEKSSSKQFRLHYIDELDTIIKRKEYYEKNTRTFFIGSPEFLQQAEKYADTLLVTVVEVPQKENAINFPSELKSIYPIRKDIHPEMLDAVKAYRKTVKVRDEVHIADNGMKFITKANVTEKQLDPIMSIPDYMFYEFRKTTVN